MHNAVLLYVTVEKLARLNISRGDTCTKYIILYNIIILNAAIVFVVQQSSVILLLHYREENWKLKNQSHNYNSFTYIYMCIINTHVLLLW